MDLDTKYPALSYLEPRAKARMPFFAWEYLASGTGADDLVAHNRAALDAGADAVVVSNHGGRQFDAAPASIEVLPEIAREVNGEVAILFDSGVRWGLDIIRALSLGADFCLLGRGFLMAVAALGDRGADHAYDILKQDLDINMVQLGARCVADLKPNSAS